MNIHKKLTVIQMFIDAAAKGHWVDLDTVCAVVDPDGDYDGDAAMEVYEVTAELVNDFDFEMESDGYHVYPKEKEIKDESIDSV